MSNPERPNVEIPHSESIVSLSIIDTTSYISGPADAFTKPVVKGQKGSSSPAYAFLIENQQQNRTILFDLGVRKDWENLAPALVRLIKTIGFGITVKKGVREILNEQGIDTSANNIEAIVWSHAHFDHTGDPSTFDSGTALIVGPGIKENLLPGYPTDPHSSLLDADFAGREVREIDFTAAKLKIGRFNAFDYFADGSFYLLDAPGHAHGHMAALARVNKSPASFVFLGGDVVHHAGELRPSKWIPLPPSLPSTIHPHTTFYPRDVCAKILGDFNATTPILQPTDGGIHLDAATVVETIGKVQELDALENILVVFAHDSSLLNVVDFFPKTAERFSEKGWKGRVRWAFLKAFEKMSKL